MKRGGHSTTGHYLAEKLAQDAAASQRGGSAKPTTGAMHGAVRMREEPARRQKSAGAKSRTTESAGDSNASRPTTAHDRISIRGARHHNLKNISLEIQLGETTVITGLSGSGKSTLAFDLLFAEGQRRYLDSLNAYARQFVDQLEKPEVDSITGIPPAVAIEQRLTRGGRKSTVATITEIYQFIRLLYSKLGDVYDPDTGERAIRQTPEEITARVEALRARHKELSLLAPLIKARKGFHTDVAKWAAKKGHPFLRVDGKWIEPEKFKALNRYQEHTIDLVLGNLDGSLKPAERRVLIEQALTLGRGTIYVIDNQANESIFSSHLYCPGSGRSFEELDPRLFSYNSPHGWCPTCRGYGTVLTLRDGDGRTELEREVANDQAQETAAPDEEEVIEACPDCQGERLNAVARHVRLPVGPGSNKSGGPTVGELTSLTIARARAFFDKVKLTGRAAVIGRDVLPEISQRLRFLENLGLDYLTLDRSATTLSGGESQRIRLAAQLGSNLRGVLYVLDEPSIGLHPRDNDRLLESLSALRGKGNTLVVVEHDEDTMRRADTIVDLGPGAGTHGGEIIAHGSWQEIARNEKSVTGKLLGEPMPHPLHGQRRPVSAKACGWMRVCGGTCNNLRGLNVDMPIGRFTAVCGVSGAGKSTLLHEIVKPAATEATRLNRSKKTRGKSVSADSEGRWESLDGAEIFTGVYEVDQSPIGKTSRSTPATYIGLMDDIRQLFAQIPLARQRGYNASRFSYNAGSGRCGTCQGQGAVKVEMNFLPSTWIPCESCNGKRYNDETLQVEYNGRNISQVLNMTIEEAADFFEAVPRLRHPLVLLRDTGLGYLALGQRSPTLSGGEAQRIKLVAELAKSLQTNVAKKLKSSRALNAHHLYILEEPTIGLHMADVRRLLEVIHQLVDAGHTVVVIEHNLDVIAEADYVIELGPEGGDKGGKVTAKGTPEQLAKTPPRHSATAPFLQKVL